MKKKYRVLRSVHQMVIGEDSKGQPITKTYWAKGPKEPNAPDVFESEEDMLRFNGRGGMAPKFELVEEPTFPTVNGGPAPTTRREFVSMLQGMDTEGLVKFCGEHGIPVEEGEDKPGLLLGILSHV